ncbi:MAG TPA: S8 family serine peptidase [Candidatus Thermoplasmatota archaeon]|nr:S8 family serine peptidase [Candidatus Thermoplasmatota archaeon]
MRARLLAPLAVALLIAPAASAGTLSTVLDEPREFLVGYNEGALGDALTLLAKLDVDVLGKNEQLRLLVVSTRATAQFLALAPADPAVEYVEGNDIVRLAGAQWNGAQWNGAQWNGAQWNGAQWNGEGGDPGAADQWGLAATRAPQAWNTTTGERRAELCVLDSGVAWEHPDLAANVWRGPAGARGFNAIDPRQSAYDDAGHGTHVAGVAAAAVRNGIGGAGVGNVSIMPVKVLGADGTGKEDDLAAGIVWCADNGADVALMALSVDEEGPTLRKALDYAAKRDVLLVASAGNTGACTSCVAYPARDANVVAVSATARDGSLAPFSARGPQVELAAPGVDIASTFVGDAYASGSGTSQAAAFVAGAAALARDADPSASARDVRDRLKASAQDLGSPGKDHSFGHGLLDVSALVGGRS